MPYSEGDLALALVAPLGANHDDVCHISGRIKKDGSG
jgi:hypothetical protein